MTRPATRPATVPALVVGGGIGGLTCALALARQGYQVTVLEKAAQFTEIGAGLQLAPNASRVLDALGILDSVTKDAFFPRRLVLMDALSGEEITALDTGGAFVERFGYPYFVTHRADLLQTLVDACLAEDAVTLQAGKEVASVRSFPTGAEVSCADGSVYQCDVLVAADGLHSTVRPLIAGESEPVQHGYVAYRGTVPMDVMHTRAGLRELNDMVIWTGPGLHLVQYPIRRGELCNQVVTFHSPVYEAGGSPWGTPEELDAAFAHVCPEVARGVSLIDRSRWWQLVDREPIETWTRDRVALLGDAAHPMLQYVAQGACQALEDAFVLADSLGAHRDDLTAGLKAYEAERQPRASRVQTTARLFGEVLHLGGMGATLRTALLRQRAHDDMTDVEWLYGYTRPDPEPSTPAISDVEETRT